MQQIKRYRSITDTLLHLKGQVIDSMPSAYKMNCKGSPERIFNALHQVFVYRSDPKGIELLQSLQTFSNINGENRHSIDWAGDCDCVTIAALALLRAAGYKDLNIVLASNYRSQPTHIYLQVREPRKNFYSNFDLTERGYNKIRNYQFKQVLPIRL